MLVKATSTERWGRCRALNEIASEIVSTMSEIRSEIRSEITSQGRRDGLAKRKGGAVSTGDSGDRHHQTKAELCKA